MEDSSLDGEIFGLVREREGSVLKLNSICIPALKYRNKSQAIESCSLGAQIVGRVCEIKFLLECVVCFVALVEVDVAKPLTVEGRSAEHRIVRRVRPSSAAP